MVVMAVVERGRRGDARAGMSAVGIVGTLPQAGAEMERVWYIDVDVVVNGKVCGGLLVVRQRGSARGRKLGQQQQKVAWRSERQART
jgi:hypothetical protein